MDRLYAIESYSPVQDESSSEATDRTPLLENMDDQKIGISSQTLVSRDDYGTARKLPQYLAALSVTMGGFALGNVLAWTSPTEQAVTKGSFYGFPVSADEWSWIGALMTLGAAAVVIPVGYLVDLLGRKNTMLMLVVPFLIGWALIIWASSVGMLYAGRFITGMAGGAFSLTAPVYTSEIAESSIRGTLGGYFQLLLTIGILFVYALGYGVNVMVLSIICGIVPIVFAVLFFFMPETPVHLLNKGQEEAARKSLLWFRGPNYNVDAELAELKEARDKAIAEKVSFKEAFQTIEARKGLLISLGLMLFQQLCGVNAVIFYTGAIFTNAGNLLEPGIATIIVGVVQVSATFVSSLVVDRAGRRILLLLSDFVMAICTLLFGVFYFLQEKGQEGSITWLPILSLSVFMIVFSLGYGPIPWMMMGEVFAPQIRGFASSLACLLNWLLAFLVTKFFVSLNVALHAHVTFWIFTGISLLGTAFVFFIVPETKGKSIQEIQQILGGQKTPIQPTSSTANP